MANSVVPLQPQGRARFGSRVAFLSLESKASGEGKHVRVSANRSADSVIVEVVVGRAGGFWRQRLFL